MAKLDKSIRAAEGIQNPAIAEEPLVFHTAGGEMPDPDAVDARRTGFQIQSGELLRRAGNALSSTGFWVSVGALAVAATAAYFLIAQGSSKGESYEADEPSEAA